MNGLNLKLILEAVDRITAPIRNIKNKLVDTFKAATKGAREMAEIMDKAGKKAAEMGGFLTARFSLPIIGVGALSIRSAGQIEQLVMQMEHLAGGAENASKFVQSLQRYIDQFGAEEVSDAVSLLETYGYSIDEIHQRLGFLGDVAAGSKNSLATLTEQYLGIRKAAKLSDGDLDSMQKARIPIVAQLEKQLGKSEQQIWNMAKNGKITFNDYRKALEGLTAEGGRFAGAMERQGKSIFGVFKEMGNALRSSLADLGFDLWRDLDIAPKIKAITEAVRGLVKGFMELPSWLKSTVTWFVLILAAIGPLMLIVGQFTVGIAGLLFAFGKLPFLVSGVVKGFGLLLGPFLNFITALRAGYTAMQAFNLVLMANPIGLIVTAVVALGVAAYMLIKHWDKVSAFFTNVWSAIKTAFKEGVASALEFLQPLLDAVNTVVGGIARIGQGVGRRIGGAWEHLTGDGTAPAAPAPGKASLVPATAGRTGSTKVDAGGTIRIQIDQAGRARVAETQNNDRRMRFQTANTGQLMGGF